MYYLCNYISSRLGHSVAMSTRNENQISIQIDNFLCKISYTIMKHLCRQEIISAVQNSQFSLWLVAVSNFENRH